MVVLIIFVPQLGATAPGLAWSSIDREFQRIAPANNLLVAEFSGNSCNTIHDVNADTRLAVASTFKLYVLGELGRQVRAGNVTWDEHIRLNNDFRSMPSGDYAWVPAGRSATIRQLAEAMMWRSDNTATDHLIDRLGRENVESAFAAYGHSSPEVNVPLLLTRELFAIKMLQPEAWMTQYMAASDTEQLAMVRTHVSPVRINPDGGWGKWNGPTAIDGIEWFASASDLCRVAVGLWTLGAQPGMEPIRDILSGNRGGVDDASTWTHVGFKNGYEAGVVNVTYVLERNDGRVFFVSAGFNHPTGTVTEGGARSMLIPVFDCLGTLQQRNDCEG
jgi:hypothetical protein